MTTSFDPHAAAQALVLARQGGPRPPAHQVPATDAAQAYAIQDATLQRLGPVGGWKVGAASPQATPNCAPLPAAGIVPAGATLPRAAHALRAVELEIAVRLRHDLPPGTDLPSRQAVLDAIDCLLPAMEVVDSRLAEGRASPPLAQLADLQNHDGLVLGAPLSLRLDALDLRALRGTVRFDGRVVADVTGGHPTGDIVALIAWLARTAAARGQPLRAGQVLTTGTWTGLQLAAPGQHVTGEFAGLGGVDLRF